MGQFRRICAVLIFMIPSLVAAQGQLVRVVVPYAPGGNIDVIGRVYAKKISELLKENWIVENVSGGNGTIGTTFRREIRARREDRAVHRRRSLDGAPGDKERAL